jgi:hypothetical protein
MREVRGKLGLREIDGFPPMLAESASPALRPLSRTAALAGTDRNGRKWPENEPAIAGLALELMG